MNFLQKTLARVCGFHTGGYVSGPAPKLDLERFALPLLRPSFLQDQNCEPNRRERELAQVMRSWSGPFARRAAIRRGRVQAYQREKEMRQFIRQVGLGS